LIDLLDFKLPKPLSAEERERIIREGDCRVKHALDAGIVVAFIKERHFDSIVVCMRCGEERSVKGWMRK